MSGINDKTALIHQLLQMRGLEKNTVAWNVEKNRLEKLDADELNFAIQKELTGRSQPQQFTPMGLYVEQSVKIPYSIEYTEQQARKTPEQKRYESIANTVQKNLQYCGITVNPQNVETFALICTIYGKLSEEGQFECWDFVKQYEDIVFKYQSTGDIDGLKKELLCKLNINFYDANEQKLANEIKLQNFTANILSGTYGFLAEGYKNMSERGSITFDFADAVNELFGGLSSSEYSKTLKESADLFSDLTPDKMSQPVFKYVFKRTFNKEYDEKAANDLMQYCIKNSQADILSDKKFKEKFIALFGENSLPKSAMNLKKMEWASTVGDICITLAGFGLINNSSMMKNLSLNTRAFYGALGLNPEGLATKVTMGAASMGAYTAVSETADNLLKSGKVSPEEWTEIPKDVIKALPFGGFASLVQAKAISPVLEKITPNGLKAAESALASGKELSFKELTKIFYGSTTKAQLTNLVSALGKSAYTVSVYGAANTVYGVTADLIANGTDNIPEGQFWQYLWENTKEHTKGMLEYEGVQAFGSMIAAGQSGSALTKPSKVNKTLSRSEFEKMDEIKVKMETVNGKQRFLINGKPVEGINTIQDVMAACHLVGNTLAKNNGNLPDNKTTQTVDKSEPKQNTKKQPTAARPTTTKNQGRKGHNLFTTDKLNKKLKKANPKLSEEEIAKEVNNYERRNGQDETKMYDMSEDVFSLHENIKLKLTNIEGARKQRIELALGFIDDIEILKYVNENIGNMSAGDLEALLYAVTEADGTLYNPLRSYEIHLSKDENINKLNDLELFEYDVGKKNAQKMVEQYEFPDEIGHDKTRIPTDMEMRSRFSHLQEYLGKNPNTKMSNYLYEKYYLSQLSEFGVENSIINELKNINNKYGLKIMVSSQTKGLQETLDFIKEELNTWDKASDGKFKIPSVIDFNGADFHWYYSKSSAYHLIDDNSMRFSSHRNSFIKMVIRHELLHVNEINTGHNLDPTRNLKTIFDETTVEKYEQEFRNAGIPDSFIDYAFSNYAEFIAVATQGDMSKYSLGFKQVLISMGMPEWMFNFPNGVIEYEPGAVKPKSKKAEKTVNKEFSPKKQQKEYRKKLNNNTKTLKVALRKSGKFSDSEIDHIMSNVQDDYIASGLLEKLVSLGLYPEDIPNKRILPFGDLEAFTNLLGNEDFVKYAKGINKSAIEQIAPAVKNFGIEEYLIFLKYHFELGHSEITPDMLRYKGDLSRDLGKNPLSARDVTVLLSQLPNTNRNIGSLPVDWFEGISQDNVSQVDSKIRDCFQKFTASEYPDVTSFTNNLSTILGKDVQVEMLGSGVSATCYKVSIDKGTAVAVKVFNYGRHNLDLSYEGRTAEPQMGLFLNNNSNKYVHMFFGTISSVSDNSGYLVTQYLDNGIKPIEGKENSQFNIFYYDNKPANYINGIRIDYGTTDIVDADKTSPDIISKKRQMEYNDKLFNGCKY